MALYVKQTKLLVVKNLKLHVRNPVVTGFQVLIGVLLIALLAVMEAAVSANSRTNEAELAAVHPSRLVVPPLERCTPGADSPLGLCYSFVYSPNNSAAADAVVDSIIALSSGIPSGRGAEYGVLSFGAPDEVDTWLVNNPNTTQLSLVFHNPDEWSTAGSAFKYAIQANSTPICRSLGVLECSTPDLSLVAAAQYALDTAFIRMYGGPAAASLTASYSNVPHPDSPSRFDVWSQYGATFMYVSLFVVCIVQLTLITSEKEHRLVEAMKQMGLLDSAYWTSWVLSETIFNVATALVIILFGVIVGADFFIDNAFGLSFFFLWLSLLGLTGLALLGSAVTKTAQAARSLALLFYVLPILVLLYYSQDREGYADVRNGLSFLVPFPFFKGVFDLISESTGVSRTGMSWSERSTAVSPFFTLEDVMLCCWWTSS